MFSRPCALNNGIVKGDHPTLTVHYESVMYGCILRVFDSFVMFFPRHVGGDKS